MARSEPFREALLSIVSQRCRDAGRKVTFYHFSVVKGCRIGPVAQVVRALC